MKKRNVLLMSMLLVLAMLIAACGGSSSRDSAESADTSSSAESESSEADAGSGEAVTIKYELWDANQLPPYEQCAADFMAANPNIEVEIVQTGWGDYWANLQTGMVAGTAPDIFTNHLAKYPEFASKNQLVDIQPLVDRDGVDTEAYIGDLALLWTRDGKRFGLPKDWDTISVIYNKDMMDAAGVTVEELNAATWNPQDGGTYEEILARLTIDENGNDGLSPDFDMDNVEQYGLVTEYNSGGPYGQTQWSHYAVSNGFQFIDDLYATEYHYDDPALIETIDWYSGLSLDKGYAMPYEEVASLGQSAGFTSGSAALTTDGSWMIGFYNDNSQDFEVGFARLPEGPEGRRSMFNGLADSIWTGSEHQDEAWEFVKYLASAECANVVGEAGVVFPAQADAVDKALAAFEEKGLDVSSFTAQALEEDGTFLFPVTDGASEITQLMDETMQSIFLGQTEPADTLPAANEEVNSILQE